MVFSIDPQNTVVKLCAAGIQAEGQGRFAEARALYRQAWEASRDDYEACIAAHYLARGQDSAQENLRWNLEALRRALAAGEERARAFYPSLYLNLGFSYEQLGDPAKAARCYDLACGCLDSLPPGAYRETVLGGIRAGQARTAGEAAPEQNAQDRER